MHEPFFLLPRFATFVLLSYFLPLFSVGAQGSGAWPKHIILCHAVSRKICCDSCSFNLIGKTGVLLWMLCLSERERERERKRERDNVKNFCFVPFP